MDSGIKRVKHTGYTPSIRTAKGKGSAPVESTAAKKASPVLKNAPTMAVSPTTGGELTAAKLLAVNVMMGDYRALKMELPLSWCASSNGKIYWCAELTGHKMSISEGKILVDGLPVENVIAKLLVNHE